MHHNSSLFLLNFLLFNFPNILIIIEKCKYVISNLSNIIKSIAGQVTGCREGGQVAGSCRVAVVVPCCTRWEAWDHSIEFSPRY